MTAQIENIAQALTKNFKFTPTSGQNRLFTLLEEFLEDEDDRSIFVLKGFAGTGKTTVLSTLMKVLPKFGWKSVLLAPTGRAAKIMSNYSGKKSQTIHRKIYKQVEDAHSGNLVFKLQPNTSEGTLFIVDEASMISDTREFGQNGLLHDLINFVFEGQENKLLLIGDEAQLPPVGMALSPALDINHLQDFYHSKVFTQTLTEVMRQQQASGILLNATALREQLTEKTPDILLNTKGFKDFFNMPGDRIEDGLQYAYQKYGQENTILITRSNRNAVQYNRLIRNRINGSEAELDKGDILMIVKNNYSVLGEDSEAGFIANGEFAQVRRLGREEEMHGFRFQNVTLTLVDYPEEPEFDTMIILDTLYSNSPSLTIEENKRLYESVIQDYFWVKTKKERKKRIREDKYLNALQVKFAYALTCHKSQGGQWEAVFIDQLYLQNNEIDHETLRWLYTAITRGISEVFLVNFNPKFFGIKTED
ncbi:MAG: AAA family ATPase [Cytophagaceae bacterium]|nr:AAA family ATPase [Cytophagaceae bacterium]MBK9936420.1 AAA family ATPase [Cytophagaceae bacterium]MBL0300170.1 AAA family ATPase [Cytophagaceae bacterium]MBL0327106.1 AAA family ATPase [Cytophagaceae bacterium]